MSLAEKRLFLLDMDGTIYLSETLFDGTLDFLRYVRAIGGRYLFLTNNSSRGTDAYIAKMARLGIEAFPDDFLTSADTAIRYLRGRYLPDTVYYVCITETLQCIVSDIPQTLDTFRFGFNNVQCFTSRCRCRRRTTCLEYIRAGIVAQPVDNLLVASNKTTDRSQ